MQDIFQLVRDGNPIAIRQWLDSNAIEQDLNQRLLY
jgi:hypothetical protein